MDQQTTSFYVLDAGNTRVKIAEFQSHALVNVHVFEVSQKVNSKQQFSKEDVKEAPRKNIPAYTIGNPLCGEDGVCYLEFDDAYDKKS